MLIAANIVIFLLINIIVVLFNGLKLNSYFQVNIVDAFTLVGFHNHFSTRFYTLITYMFSHFGFSHLLTNMLMLLLFGQVIENLLSVKKLMLIYFLGGILGGLFFIFLCSVFPNYHYQTLIGASCSVLAVITAATYLSPDYEVHLLIIGRVKIKYLSAIIVFILMFNAFNPAAFAAHIGGCLAGLLYIFFLKRNIDLYDMISLLQRPSNQHPKAVIKENKTKKILTDKQRSQEKLDEILDKINASGYHNLTLEEKEFLQKISNE